MTKRKFLSLLLAIMCIICMFSVVSCDIFGSNENEKTEWPEAGEYTFTAGTTECTLTLKVGDTFTLVYKGATESGTYTLTDSKLVLDFTADGKENVEATYAETSITLAYDGANMVLYKNINYTVTFSVNGGSAVSAQTVVNGQKATQPEAPTRVGYDFLGWYADAGFKTIFNFDTPITANTTLYARWLEDTKLPEPAITVTANRISWNTISGVRSYYVEIIAPNGDVIYDEETGSTVINFSFKDLDPAIYTVRVTAKAQSGAQDNSVKEVTYAFNALDKVSGFQIVDPGLVVFNEVENAEKYYITVVCGDAGHNHTNLDIGTNKFFSIENCVMTADGIQISVTAEAEGYASSVSETFVYKNVLSAVEGLAFNSDNHTVVWNAVPGASAYMVSVKCGDETHNHDFVNVGTDTFVNVKDCAPLDGGIIVKVYPIGNLALSSAPSTYIYNKTDLQTPSEFVINGTVLSWKAVNNAVSYEIKIGNNVYTSTTNVFDMASVIGTTVGTEYSVSVRALGNSASSIWSDNVTALYKKMGGAAYSKGTLTWAPVIGISGYEIQVNDGEIVSVAGGSTSSAVVLTKEGVNSVKVRFVDGSNRSEWVNVDVTAYSVTFDTLGGSAIVVQYKAVGDPMSLPGATKTGYTFTAWYDVPGGASANGKVYNDAFFAGEASITVYAQYSANQYDVTYNCGTLGNIGVPTGSVTFDSNYTLDVPAAKDAANVFGGWYSEAGGKGVQYTDEKGNSLAPWTIANGAELHAFWIEQALSFTLTEVNGKAAYMVSKGARISMLTEVTVPAYYDGLPVAMVAGNAFLNCPTLKVINLPATIEQISNITPFGGCVSLEAVNIYDVENVVARFWSDNGVVYDNGTSSVADPGLFFMPATKSGSYTIPDGVTNIPAYALSGSKLSEIVIPASVTTIGREAFANSKSLNSVVFVTGDDDAPALRIGANAFKGCTALVTITLPARLNEIKLGRIAYVDGVLSSADADDAFAGCTALKAINVENAGTYSATDGILYANKGLTIVYCPAGKTFDNGKLEIAAGTTTISTGAFYGCSGISEIVVPTTVTVIDSGAFYGMSALTKVTLKGDSASPITIGNDAFNGCTKLETLAFEPGCQLTTIGERAFAGCTKLSTVTIPGSVAEIKAKAFEGCTSISAISFESGAQGATLVFGDSVFSGCTALTTITLPASVTAIPGVFAGCSSLTSVYVDEANPYLASDEDGVVYNKAMTELIFFPAGKAGSDAEYTIPEGVKKIGDGVFKGMRLDTLEIPNTIEVIGNEAFMGGRISDIVFYGETYGTSLTIGNSAFAEMAYLDITLPKHTTSIGDYAFASLSDFYGVTLNEGIVSLGDYAFYDSESYSWSTKVTIPTTVKSIGAYCFAEGKGNYEFVTVELDFENSVLEYIGKYAFAGNDLDYLEGIPASVKVIDDYAFYGCYYLGYSSFEIAEGSVLEYIGAHAFDGCGYLAEITIPKTVKIIKAYAFANCSDLETVIFEEGGSDALVLGSVHINVVGEAERGYVFSRCGYLETVILPERLVEIGQYSFYNAGSSLWGSYLTVGFGENSNLATIGDYAFYYSNLQSIVIPKSVRNLAPYVDSENGVTYDRMGIGNYAFYYMYNSLESVTFEQGGNDPLTIGAGAFENCKLLTTITLPARLAPYVNSLGETVAPLANGAGVFASNECAGLASVFVEDGSIYYSSDENGVLYNADKSELVYYPVTKEGAFVVPASVKKIGDKAFYYAEKLTAITFADGSLLEAIGASAFERCTSLEVITLPTGVKTLGESVFKKCTSLATLNLSKSLTTFNGGMVDGCTALANVNVEAGSTTLYSDNGVLYNGDKTYLLLYPVMREGTTYTVLSTTARIENYAFNGNRYLEVVVLPEGLAEIGKYAFASNSSLTTINIPSTVTLIDEWAFSNCYYLENVDFAQNGTEDMVINKYAFQQTAVTSIELPARVTYLGDYVFYYSSLESIEFAEDSRLTELGNAVFYHTPLVDVVLPDGIVTIGDEVFGSCSYLESVTFGEGLVTLGDKTFVGSSVVRVHFPATLKTIGAETFYEVASLETVTFAPNAQLEKIPAGTFYASGLKSIIIPASVKEIEDKDVSTSYSKGAFENCTALVSVDFEDGSVCELIGIYAFKGCTALVTAELPAALITLGNSAFEECSSLLAISIPATVTQLGDSIFRSCTSLATVVLDTKATALPSYMFAYCEALTEITIPSNVASIDGSTFTGASIASFNVVSDSKFFVAVDGVIYSLDKSKIVMYPPKKPDSVLVIPKEVTEIGDGTFSGNSTLKVVIFEDGGTADLIIGVEAFYRCDQLHTVILPERLTVIMEYAFMYCYSLTDITVPSTVIEIQDDAFYGCYKLVEVYNKSELDISLDNYYDHGYIANNAMNVYTPTDGSSQLSLIDEYFLVYDYEGMKYLIAYKGDSLDIVIPEGIDGLYSYLFYYNDKITSVIIPEGIEDVGYSMFTYCDNLTILCRAASKPSGWSNSWNGSCPVVWGYTGADVTYNFVTNGAGTVDSITSQLPVTLPDLVLEGHYFMGWYDNAEFSGNAYTGEFYRGESLTLYAKFLTEEQYIEEMLKGTSKEYAFDGVSGGYYEADIANGGDKVWVKITVEAGESWNIKTNHVSGDTSDHAIWIDAEDGSVIKSKWDSGYTEDKTYTFTEAGTYYIGIGCYYDYKTGRAGVTITNVT